MPSFSRCEALLPVFVPSASWHIYCILEPVSQVSSYRKKPTHYRPRLLSLLLDPTFGEPRPDCPKRLHPDVWSRIALVLALLFESSSRSTAAACVVRAFPGAVTSSLRTASKELKLLGSHLRPRINPYDLRTSRKLSLLTSLASQIRFRHPISHLPALACKQTRPRTCHLLLSNRLKQEHLYLHLPWSLSVGGH